MQMLRLSTILLFLFAFAMASAQSGRQLRPLYRLDGGKFQNKGWFIGPGATYTLPAKHDNQTTRTVVEGNTLDTLFTGAFDAGGQIGAYLEVGRFHFFKNPILVHYIDYGIHYKMLRGKEDFTGTMLLDTDTALTLNSTFNRHHAGAFFNAYYVHQLTDHTFLQAGIGLNLDYAVSEKINAPEPRTQLIEKNADTFTGQLHAKIGFGYKAESGVFLVPSIETPILTVYPLDDGKSTLPMFSSRYRPIIFSLRIMWFSKTKAADCVGSNDNPSQGDLWGRDMRKGGKKKRR